ncbi:DNA transformation protein TfoX, partial [Vibrio nigripulchritudo ATCC 27043]
SWENTDDIIEKASQALKVARTEKQKQAETKPTRLKDLPNLRLGTERMLKKAGISSVQELQDYGSVEAYKAIKQTHSSDVGLELLWALEGAIKGTHWSVIPQDRRDELMKRLS